MSENRKSNREIDMIHGPLGSKILMFSLPLAATGILQQLFNSADVAVVGQFVGKEAMAAVGANTAIVNLLVGTFVGMSLGSSVTLANAIGRGDRGTIRKVVHTSLLLALFCGVLVTVFGEMFAVNILESQSVPSDVMPMAVAYLRIYLLGVPVILFYNFEAAVFRGAGNTRTPLLVLTISGFVNVFLNLFFVILMGMNADGVALATVLSNLISALILFVALLRAKGDVRIIPKEFHIDRKVLMSVLGIGVPAGIQSGVFSFANIIIQGAINSLGATVMAASSAAVNLEFIVYYVLTAFGQACTTFTGQNFGAGKINRCRRTLIICFLQDAAATAISVFIVLFFGKQLLHLFNGDPEVIAIGYTRLVYIFFAYIFTMITEVLSGYLRGFGISLAPALISIFGICGTRLLWIFYMFPKSPGFITIMTVYPISLAITAAGVVIAFIIIRLGRMNLEEVHPESMDLTA